MNEPKQEKVKAYLRRLLDAVNRVPPAPEDPPLLHVKYQDHLRFFGWGIGRAIERMEQGAFLKRLGWKVWEDREWILLWEGGRYMESRAILKNCIIEEKRMDTPETVEALRWVLAGCLILMGPKFDRLLSKVEE